MADFQTRFNELIQSYAGNDTDVARLLGVTKQAVSNWKAGTRSPRKDTILVIARVFNVSLEWLMGFDVPREQGTTINSKGELAKSPAPRSGLTDEDLAKIAQIVSDRHPEMSDAPRTEEARILASGIDKLPQADRVRALEFIRMLFVDHADLFPKEDTDT